MSLSPGFYFCDFAGDPYYEEKAQKFGRFARFNVVCVAEDGQLYCVGSEMPSEVPEVLPSDWTPISLPINQADTGNESGQ